MWLNYHIENTPSKKVQILEKIEENQVYLSSYYDSTRYVLQRAANRKVKSQSRIEKIKSYPFYNTDDPLLSETDQLDIFKGKTFLEFNETKKTLLFSSNSCIPLLVQRSR
jgi:hypothetical protein